MTTRPTTLRYREVAPPRALADRVACVWWIAAEPSAGPPSAVGGAPGGARDATAPRAGGYGVADAPPAAVPVGADHLILPDGSVDLVWHAGALTVAGPDTRARRADGAGPAVGVRLRPGAAATLGPDGAALRDDHPSAGAVWGPDGTRLERALGDAPAADRPGMLLRAVARRAADAPPTDPAVDRAVALLASGRATVADAARATGTGERRLRRRFDHHVGYAPKTLHRVLRLQRLLRLAITTRDGLPELAFAAGYADQAHMARETRALAGTTPSALVAARRPVGTPAPPR